MAKAATIKVKLVSTADTGYFYVTKKNSRTMTEKLVDEEVRPGREEARRVQGSQDQVSFQADRSQNKNRLIEAVFSFQGRSKPKA